MTCGEYSPKADFLVKFIYCDESNLNAKSGDFLLYGGLMIDADKYLKFSDRIWALRKEHGIPNDFVAKYLPAPTNLNTDDYNTFKKACIQECINFGCNFFVYKTLHDVAKDTDLARRNGINEICLNFSYVLDEEETSGLVLIDRFNDKGNKVDAHLTEKFHVGLTGLPFSDTYPLKRIVGLHYSSIGQSHMPSLVDIVLGTYRTAINIIAREKALSELSIEILSVLQPLFRTGHDGCIPRISISFSPQTVNVAKYRETYADLIMRMNFCGYQLTQEYN